MNTLSSVYTHNTHIDRHCTQNSGSGGCGGGEQEFCVCRKKERKKHTTKQKNAFEQRTGHREKERESENRMNATQGKINHSLSSKQRV